MRYILVSQRVDVARRSSGSTERRDGLDQRWATFLAAAGLLCIPAPNSPALALRIVRDLPIDGLVLTGGNDLVSYGGDAPERDRTEADLLAFARTHRLPVIGVCRGMQVIQHAFGVQLRPVDGHVTDALKIDRDGTPAAVSSAHRWGADHSIDDLPVWATARDGVVKAIRHRREPLVGLMWHPERANPADPADLALFAGHFSNLGSAA